MKKKNFKGRCEKKSLSKCEDVCKTYNAIQSAYANILQDDDRIKEFVCNVPLVGLELGEYTTDFLCTKINGAVMVRECVYHKFLTKPMTVRLLETSKDYWTKSGVKDWGLVVNEEEWAYTQREFDLQNISDRRGLCTGNWLY